MGRDKDRLSRPLRTPGSSIRLLATRSGAGRWNNSPGVISSDSRNIQGGTPSPQISRRYNKCNGSVCQGVVAPATPSVIFSAWSASTRTTCTPISSRRGDRHIEDRLFATSAPPNGAFSLRCHQQLYSVWPVIRHLLYAAVQGIPDFGVMAENQHFSAAFAPYNPSSEAALSINEKTAGRETCTTEWRPAAKACGADLQVCPAAILRLACNQTFTLRGC